MTLKFYYLHLLYTYLNAQAHQKLQSTYYPQFPIAYQQKLDRYRRWEDMQASMLGRLLLYKGLSLFYGYDLNFEQLKYGEYGKPYLADTELCFNISHSHELVVCAIQAGGVVGVDVEYIRPVPISDFHSQMTENEWRIVSEAVDPTQAFYDYWTSKEAILKVEGSGIQLGLKTFEVREDRKIALVKNRTWHLQKCELDTDYYCYLASGRKIKSVSLNYRFSF